MNAVVPGLIETEMLEGTATAEMAKQIPMQRLGRPEEVAALVDFLFSEGASYITGEAISVNGGMLQARAAVFFSPGEVAERLKALPC